MIGWGHYFDLLCRKTWDIAEIYRHIGQISRYFKKYRNIEIAWEISISLSIYRKIFGNIVIDIEIPNIAQPYYRSQFGVRKSPNLPVLKQTNWSLPLPVWGKKKSEFACFKANWSLPLPVWVRKSPNLPVLKQTGRYRSQFGVRKSPNLPVSKQTGRYRSQFGVRKSPDLPALKQTGRYRSQFGVR